MRLKYHDMQNVISYKFNLLSRKNRIDSVSCESWMTELSSAGYSTLFKQHAGEGAPFLIAWISPWQKDVSSIKRLFTTKILFSVNHYFYLDSCSKRPLIGVLIALTRPASLWMVKMIHIFLQLLSLVPLLDKVSLFAFSWLTRKKQLFLLSGSIGSSNPFLASTSKESWLTVVLQKLLPLSVHLVMMYKFYYATGISKELGKLTWRRRHISHIYYVIC